MEKYVYKNENGIAILDKKVEILELASISDLRKARKDAEENIKRQEQNWKNFLKNEDYKTTRSFDDDLGINLKDWLILKEDTFMWDEDLNDYVSVEGSQTYDNPYSWTEVEKVEFAEVMIDFIGANDLTSELYDYLRDINTEDTFVEGDNYTRKFERLFHKELEAHTLKLYEKHYQKRKQQYQELLKSQNFNFVTEAIH